MRDRLRVLLTMGWLVLTALLCACQTSAPLSVARVGVAAPLTGERAADGRDVTDAVALAVDETNYIQAATLVRNAAVQIVYVIGHGYDAGSLWADLRTRDARVRLALAPGAYDEGFRRTAGGFFEGVIVVEPMVHPGDAP